jgi:chaperonin cofactor prefoldin
VLVNNVNELKNILRKRTETANDNIKTLTKINQDMKEKYQKLYKR